MNASSVPSAPVPALGGAGRAQETQQEEPQPVAEPAPDARAHDPVPVEPLPDVVVFVNPGYAHWACLDAEERKAMLRAAEAVPRSPRERATHPGVPRVGMSASKFCRRCHGSLADPPPTERDWDAIEQASRAIADREAEGFVIKGEPS